MDEQEEATMMTMNLQCDQLTVLLQREVRYRRPAATAVTTAKRARAAADMKRQKSSRTVVVQQYETTPKSNSLVQNRPALCNWTFEVVHRCGIPTHTVHLAMNLFDRYNAAATRFKHASSHQVSKKTPPTTAHTTTTTTSDGLPLIMAASLYIALKLNCEQAFSSVSFASLSQGQFTAVDVEVMETKILRVLDWLVHPPTCHEFVHSYVSLLILLHKLEEQEEQRQLQDHPRRRGRGIAVSDWTTSRIVSSPGASFITPISGPIHFHYGMFSNGRGYGYNNKRTPTYRDVMESILFKACQIMDTTVGDYGFVQFKPSAVACAALYYSMQQHYDDGYFYHIYPHDHPFPSPLEQLHSLGVMVHASEASRCLEYLYLLFEEAQEISVQEQQESTKNRFKKEDNTTKRTTSPNNVMDQHDAVDDP